MIILIHFITMFSAGSNTTQYKKSICQHSFLKNKSCQTISSFDQITSCSNLGNALEIIHLNFSKAFDKRTHDLLISRLIKCSQEGMITKWIHTWFENCAQTVFMVSKNPTLFYVKMPPSCLLCLLMDTTVH